MEQSNFEYDVYYGTRNKIQGRNDGDSIIALTLDDYPVSRRIQNDLFYYENFEVAVTFLFVEDGINYANCRDKKGKLHSESCIIGYGKYI